MIDTVPIHTVKVAFESVQVSRPEAPELGKPGVELLKWPGFQPIQTALRVYRGFDEACIAQHPQMFRHHRLRHAKPALDLSNRLF